MTSPTRRPMWTLEEAQQVLARVAIPMNQAGIGVGLTGSVLTRGESKNDLDLVLYPLTTALDRWPVIASKVLAEEGFELVVAAYKVKVAWRNQGSSDDKLVEVWRLNRKRVDVFYLR